MVVTIGQVGPTARACVRADDGYVLVDALVALLILSVSISGGLVVLHQARAVAAAAWEVRRADTLAAHLLEAAPHRRELSSGTTGDFAWSVQTTTTGAERPIEVCRRAVAVRNVRTGRTFAAATLDVCPLEPAA